MILSFLFQQVYTHQEAILPLAILAGATVLGAGGKLFRGLSQDSKADAILKNSKRPIRTTQEEFKRNAALAAFRAANSKLPGANTAENRASSMVQSGVNNLINTQRDPASIAVGIAALDKNYNDTVVNLADKGAQFQNNLINTSYQQNSILGQQNQLNWDWNEKQKYLSAMASASALKNAANNNIDNAVQDVASIGTAYAFNQLDNTGGKVKPLGTPGATNPASTVPPYNYPFENSFPTSIPETGSTTPDNSKMDSRKAALLRIYGSEANFPPGYEIFKTR